MTQLDRQAVWANGIALEAYVGRWSRQVAREFLAWLSVRADRRWLDIGCGTGALSETILGKAAPSFVCGIDPSEAYITFVRENLQDVRAHFEVGDAQLLPIETEAFDAAVSGLVLNFVPNPQRALAEMARVTRPGGVVAGYVWDYAEGMELMRYFWDAAIALDPSARDLDEAERFPLCRPELLINLFGSARLHDVEVRAIEVPTIFRDFDDYWTPFLGGQGPAPGYAMSLSEEHRALLREHLCASFPIAPDGSIRLSARAWAVRGTVA